MQKNCASCAHVGVCSKRMQFIVNNYLAKGHYEEIENVSKTLDISVNCNDYNEKNFFSFLCERVRDYSDGQVDFVIGGRQPVTDSPDAPHCARTVRPVSAFMLLPPADR